MIGTLGNSVYVTFPANGGEAAIAPRPAVEPVRPSADAQEDRSSRDRSSRRDEEAVRIDAQLKERAARRQELSLPPQAPLQPAPSSSPYAAYARLQIPAAGTFFSVHA